LHPLLPDVAQGKAIVLDSGADLIGHGGNELLVAHREFIGTQPVGEAHDAHAARPSPGSRIGHRNTEKRAATIGTFVFVDQRVGVFRVDHHHSFLAKHAGGDRQRVVGGDRRQLFRPDTPGGCDVEEP